MSRYIDADKLIAKLHSGDNYATILPPAIREIEEMLIDEMVGYVNETLTEDVKPIVYGEWIDCGLYVYECSNCYNSLEMWWEDKYEFCPNCGADMRKEQEND